MLNIFHVISGGQNNDEDGDDDSHSHHWLVACGAPSMDGAQSMDGV